MAREAMIITVLIIVGLFGLMIQEGMPHDNNDITGFGIKKKFKKAWRRVEKEVSRSTNKVEAEGKRLEDRVKAEVKRWDSGSPEAKDIKKKSVERARESIDRMHDKVVAVSRDKLCQMYIQAMQEGKDDSAAYEQTTSILKADLRPSIHSMLVANALTFITLAADEAAKAANDLQGDVEPLADYQARKVLDAVVPACRQMIPAQQPSAEPAATPAPVQQPPLEQASQPAPAAQPTPEPVQQSAPPAGDTAPAAPVAS